MPNFSISTTIRFLLPGPIIFIFFYIADKEEIETIFYSINLGFFSAPVVLFLFLLVGSITYFIYRPIYYNSLITRIQNKFRRKSENYRTYLMKLYKVTNQEAALLWTDVRETYFAAHYESELKAVAAGIHLLYMIGFLAIPFLIKEGVERNWELVFLFFAIFLVSTAGAFLYDRYYEERELYFLKSVDRKILNEIARKYGNNDKDKIGNHAISLNENIHPGDPDKVSTSPDFLNSPINVLFLCANPMTTLQKDMEYEVQYIDGVLQKANLKGKFAMTLYSAAAIKDLTGIFLRLKPDIVHFSGYGCTSSEIVLTGGNGGNQTLRSIFELLSGNIRCVLLSACYSEEQARIIGTYIDYVIGTNKGVGDKAAIQFANGFYEALGYGMSIETAFKLGCVQIDLSDSMDSDVPNLLYKGELN